MVPVVSLSLYLYLFFSVRMIVVEIDHLISNWEHFFSLLPIYISVADNGGRNDQFYKWNSWAWVLLRRWNRHRYFGEYFMIFCFRQFYRIFAINILQHDRFYQDMCASKWYLLPPKYQKTLVLMLHAAQQPQPITAFHILPLNANTFLIVMSAIFRIVRPKMDGFMNYVDFVSFNFSSCNAYIRM